jgi:hypothetical protein
MRKVSGPVCKQQAGLRFLELGNCVSCGFIRNWVRLNEMKVNQWNSN